MQNHFITLLGGSALLIYSMEQLSKTFQYLADSRFRIWINTFAGNRFAGFVLGLILSLLMSSSGAVTVMLVGLANARMLTLPQVLSVILGASVGTTFIVQLVAFDIASLSLLLVAIAVTLSALAKTDDQLRTCQIFLFVGLMFFSMSLVKQAGVELETNEFFRYTISYFRDRPSVSLLIAAAFTAIIHSSAATVAFVMTLMVARGAPISDAIPWILGANLGTTATAYLASFRGGALGKQAALANLLIKVTGLLLCYPFMNEFSWFLSQLSSDLGRQIAHAHTFFNLGIAVLFLPFIPLGAKVVRYFVPEKADAGPFSYRFLDPRSLSVPELALAQAKREILRLSDMVEEMVRNSIDLFQGANQQKIDAIRSTDRVVDFMNKGIKLHLTKLSQKEMTPEQVHREFEFLFRTNDLESIGDIVDKEIISLVRKNIKKGYAFSEEGWADIKAFHSKVVECLELSNAYFTSGDKALAVKVILLHEEIDELIVELNEQHIHRLHRGVEATLKSTSVHLDLLGHLHRISNLSIQFMRLSEIRPPEETPREY